MPSAMDLAERYGKALEEYVLREGEGALRQAYEIGRRAVASNVGILGMLGAHEQAVAALLARSPSAIDESLRRQMDAATRFLSESVSPFEMFCVRNQEANAALRRMNEMLEEEAKRVAHAVHDQAGTLLATVYLDLAAIARELPPAAVERMQRITAHLDEVREQLRHLSHEVHPPILDHLGLVPALEYLAEGIGQRKGLAVTVEGSGVRDFPQTVSTAVYRVVQEALSNVTRHAQATRASVRLWKDGGTLNCLVRDDGTGFDIASVRARRTECGLGLIGMEERVRALGGEFQVTSARGQGTTIRISLPRQRG